uniref:Uncharacterized protein n=1 Tax=Schistosoma haematobium TaxID=6185 RepID=A0A094ZR20_SCHHA
MTREIMPPALALKKTVINTLLVTYLTNGHLLTSKEIEYKKRK